MVQVDTPCREISGCDPAALPEEVLASPDPIILRGLVAEWPVVKAGEQHPHRALADLRSYYRDKPVSLLLGEPKDKGRFFYNEDLSGFNFHHLETNLAKVLDKLIEIEGEAEPPTLYVGSTAVDNWLPGFRQHNDLNLGEFNPLVSIWIGNRSRVAAHFDYPENIACCVLGKRRFTLFPPDQIANLYIGPVDLTPAGQAISLVDFANPDLEKYPRFSEALASAQVADLNPGDALFLPSMWWHHVEALDTLNILVNYWWNPLPQYLGYPADALTNAMFSIRQLPLERRRAWQAYFNHYVFDEPGDCVDHIPESARGRLGDLDETSARRLRAELLNKLKQ